MGTSTQTVEYLASACAVSRASPNLLPVVSLAAGGSSPCHSKVSLTRTHGHHRRSACSHLQQLVRHASGELGGAAGHAGGNAVRDGPAPARDVLVELRRRDEGGVEPAVAVVDEDASVLQRARDVLGAERPLFR